MARKISKKVKTEAVREYRNSHVSLREVAQKYGVTAESVRRWAGFKTRPRGTKYTKSNPAQISAFPGIVAKRTRKSPKTTGFDNANKRWTKTEDELLRDAVMDNLTVSQTAHILGRSEPSIWSRKCILIDRGFIDENKRFPIPEGVTRNRPTGIVPNRKREESEEINETAIVNIGKIELSDLAMLVKKYNVGVTLTISQKGTEVKVHN